MLRHYRTGPVRLHRVSKLRLTFLGSSVTGAGRELQLIHPPQMQTLGQDDPGSAAC